MEFSVREYDRNDIGILTNYVLEAYEDTNTPYTKRESNRIKCSILTSERVMVVASGSFVIGFYSLRYTEKGNVFVLSYYLNKDYRRSKAKLILFNSFMVDLEDCDKAWFEPLCAVMTLPKAVPMNGKIDLVRLREFHNRIKYKV